MPQFPIIYINTFYEQKRLIACPVVVSYEVKGKICDATFLTLTNVETAEKYTKKLGEELSERIGLSKKISKEDFLDCCNLNSDYIALFCDLWTYVKSSYGDYIPYGKYYEEIYSIVRFVSAWQPKTGRQSEMRMLYNFMSSFGEDVTFLKKWNHLEFYIIPNLHDIFEDKFEDFHKFKILTSIMTKLYANFFTKDVIIQNTLFKVMPKAWKQNKNDFINLVTIPLTEKGILTVEEKFYAEKLVDVFNRNSWRAAFFISSYMNILNNYKSWNKMFFQEFYKKGSLLKGYSQKVIACFLQQGFGNPEVIPIDTWIETFYKYPLGIDNQSEFFESFSNLGKLERIIWLSSQSNKTNMKNFYNILWCQRYGVTGNSKLRGINPISCYRCLLNGTCIGLNKNKNSKVLIINTLNEFENVTKTYKTFENNITYICLLENRIPKKVYKSFNSNWILIDEFSGYLLTELDKITEELIKKKIVSLGDFILN